MATKNHQMLHLGRFGAKPIKTIHFGRFGSKRIKRVQIARNRGRFDWFGPNRANMDRFDMFDPKSPKKWSVQSHVRSVTDRCRLSRCSYSVRFSLFFRRQNHIPSRKLV